MKTQNGFTLLENKKVGELNVNRNNNRCIIFTRYSLGFIFSQ